MIDAFRYHVLGHRLAATVLTATVLTGMVYGAGQLCKNFDVCSKGLFDLKDNKVLHQILGETPKPNGPQIKIQ